MRLKRRDEAAAFNPATPATAVATAGGVNAADYEQWTYDANDNVTVDRKRDGREVVIDYDNLDRRQTRRYRNAGTDEPTANWAYYDYDLRGLQISAAFGSIAGPGVANLYDNAGRITRATDTTGGPARALNYLYDPASNRIRITHPDTAYFTYDYDGLSRVTAIRENGATALVTLGYDNKGEYHAKAVIVPEDQKRYARDRRFVAGPGGIRIATIGAGPDTWRNVFGPLVADTNRPRDVETLAGESLVVAEIVPSPGDNENDLIERMFAVADSYGDDLEYSLFPTDEGDDYNSNSFLYGFFRALGTMLPIPHGFDLPGARKPIPRDRFCRPNRIGCARNETR